MVLGLLLLEICDVVDSASELTLLVLTSFTRGSSLAYCSAP